MQRIRDQRGTDAIRDRGGFEGALIGMSGRHLDQWQAGASNNDYPEHSALKSAAQRRKRRVNVGDLLLLQIRTSDTQTTITGDPRC